MLNKNVFVCCECGFESAKWNGICPSCNQGNTMFEETKSSFVKKFKKNKRKIVSESISDINVSDETRYKTNIKELDRTFGGGIVKGSLVLISGSPGIGKSTILLQICSCLNEDLKIFYISGEESKSQIKMRASRLNIKNKNLFIITETDIELIIEEIENSRPNLVIIDSIQTMCYSEISSIPGSVSQVKECSNLLLKLSKSLEISILIVGHVNKDGVIAGPKVLEHIVDVVLYFEGENQNSYRILRAAKNRFGSTNELGVFQMTSLGLNEIQNPSLMMLSGRPKNSSGICIACTIEGSRPLLTEVQGLVTNTNFGNPRRMATGLDYNRLNLILAVLEKRAGYFFSNSDVYVNIVGGLKLNEPAADLSVALALASSLKNQVLNSNSIAFGEVGLSGEIRAVSNPELRVVESERLGFTHCVLPYHNLKNLENLKKIKIKISGVKNIKQAYESIIK
ncbi:MAG: DNA repair protein RadA [Candidatus Paraimprobicoccus trichonymphae]|uniref:DNA repair protein RadA n=1 Tax=Candidatus Paraimprobicoccus trichonymphae TaxID=3033793 RepID=A0AA48I4M7_9FIRM|nr:MAG: DNA repair protein RadA [Candidatus Paraimprobicoccus trichonymphae]